MDRKEAVNHWLLLVINVRGDMYMSVVHDRPMYRRVICFKSLFVYTGSVQVHNPAKSCEFVKSVPGSRYPVLIIW